jgi:hypothetical protein
LDFLHTLATHVPAQVPHDTCTPQLLFTIPQFLPMQAWPLSTHEHTFAVHVCGGVQLGPHETLCPQLSVVVPQFLPAHAFVGPQHLPLKQTPLMQSVPVAQFRPLAHFLDAGQFGPPQSWSVSPLFCVPSLQLPPQGAQFPPQSVPVSPAFCWPSKHRHKPEPLQLSALAHSFSGS